MISNRKPERHGIVPMPACAMSTRMVLSWTWPIWKTGGSACRGSDKMPATHDAARQVQENMMFAFDSSSRLRHAGYLACALAIAMAPMLFPSGQIRAQGMKDMPGMKGEATKTAAGTGTVTAMDTAKRKVTLDHGPIPDINWPAMKMEFPVAPSVDLSKVKTGDQVRFTLSGSGNSYTVQSINPGQ